MPTNTICFKVNNKIRKASRLWSETTGNKLSGDNAGEVVEIGLLQKSHAAVSTKKRIFERDHENDDSLSHFDMPIIYDREELTFGEVAVVDADWLLKTADADEKRAETMIRRAKMKRDVVDMVSKGLND